LFGLALLLLTVILLYTVLASQPHEFHHRTGQEGPEAELKYNSTLSLTLVLCGGGCSMPHLSRFTPGKDPVPIVQEAGWAMGPICTGAENLNATTRIRSTGCPTNENPIR
jgi:hypothetical protein